MSCKSCGEVVLVLLADLWEVDKVSLIPRKTIAGARSILYIDLGLKGERFTRH
jgi:hypothetical protein